MDNLAKPDDELIAEFRQTGDACWLDILFRRHIARVRNMVYPILLNEADADDVTQEVFFRAARGLSSFEGRAQFTTWLYRIAINTARSFLRSRARTQYLPEDLAPEPEAPRHEHPDRVLQTLEIDARVKIALATLSPRLRAALVLTTMEGLGIPAAAKVEGCSQATIYWRVFEARRRLKKELAGVLTHA